ncbi:MAG: uridine diphosphate-N-acetylglucosamine-binding protein YvcK, partial [Planctomycetes bacterium]|nr:uridine diphosphate-N-acetylglucosamine-binding protein YvcK [Planctomycetota bacterium]
IAAPGDIRNCLIALADVDPVIAEAFQYRFDESELKGHCFGNLFITVLTRVVGDFDGSIRELNRFLRVRGRVIPASSSKVSLVAHHPDGGKSTGEVQISRSLKPIERIELRPWPTEVSPEIRQAIRDADLFLFGPGSLFTSVIPNLLLEGIVEELNRTGKPRVYIGNIMTQPGETLGFHLSDHVRALRRHVGDDFPDAVIAHNGRVPADVLKRYAEQGAEAVVPDLEDSGEFKQIRVIRGDFFAEGENQKAVMSARHDSAALAQVIHDEFLKDIESPRGTKPSRKSTREQESAQAHGTRALH